MVAFNQKYVTDKDGNPVGVLLDMAEFGRIVDELEELDAIRAYDSAKSSGDVAIPIDQAIREIEMGRK